MASKNVRVNFEFLFSEARKRKITITEMSESLGMSGCYISWCKNQNDELMKEAHAKILCKLYDIDYNKLTKSPLDISKIDFDKDNKGITDRLDKIIELLEEKERKEIHLTAQEDCVLILEQMLKHGQCERAHFRAKARKFGYEQDLCKYAEEYLEVQVEVYNGKVWL